MDEPRKRMLNGRNARVAILMCHHSAGRSGLAPIEVVLALPTVICLVALFFLVVSAITAQIDANGRARLRAFHGRYADENRSTKSRSTRRDEMNAAMRLREEFLKTSPAIDISLDEQLLSVGSSSHDVEPVLRVLRGSLPPAQGHSTVLKGTWDFRTTEQEEHDPLVLPEDLMVFGMPRDDLNAFEILAQIDQVGRAANVSFRRLRGAQSSALAVISSAVRDAENTIDRLSRALVDASDTEQERIRQELDDWMSRLENLRDANHRLNRNRI